VLPDGSTPLRHSERRLPEPRNQREAAAANVLEAETPI